MVSSAALLVAAAALATLDLASAQAGAGSVGCSEVDTNGDGAHKTPPFRSAGPDPTALSIRRRQRQRPARRAR